MPQNSWKFYTFIGLFILIVAVADIFDFLPFQNKNSDEFSGEVLTFKAVVAGEPEDREWNTRLTIEILEAAPTETTDTPALISTKILVTTDRHKNIVYGDVLSVTGKLEVPENFLSETGREFDYVGFLEAKGITYRMSNPRLEVIGHDPPSKVVESLLGFKHFFTDRLDYALSEPQSSLAAGILIDGKQSIDATLQEEFKRAGIVHIVVLSGSNVTIIAETIFKIFSLFLPRLAGIGAASFGIILFALATGGAAPVVRASIMALVALLCRSAFRQYSAARALFITAVVMLCINPQILLHDPSFQLSFLATFSVIFMVPLFQSLFNFLPERFGFRDLVAATTITQFFLLPLLIYMTGTVSLVALPVNFIVLPFIPIAMLLSFVTACLSFVSGFFGTSLLALPAAFVAHIVLSYILGVAHISASLSASEIAVGGVHGFFIILSYVAIFWWAWRRKKRGEGEQKI